MGSLSNESFEQFLDSLKKAGIVISNEAELRERLAEAQRWRYAFQTLAANGKSIGISFADAGSNVEQIERAFSEFQVSEKTRAVFSASLVHYAGFAVTTDRVSEKNDGRLMRPFCVSAVDCAASTINQRP